MKKHTFNSWRLAFWLIGFVVVGVILLILAKANSGVVVVDPETGTVNAPASIGTGDSSAAGGKYVQFGPALNKTTIMVFDAQKANNFEIFSAKTDGSTQTQLTNDATYDSWYPKLSPDGSKILFARSPKGVYDRDYSQTSIWVMNRDGSNLKQLIAIGAYGWSGMGHPEWSPDGSSIALFGGGTSTLGYQIYVTDANGANPRQVTNRPYKASVDPSWSPDGKTLVFVTCPDTVSTCNAQTQDVATVPASTTNATTVTRLTSDNLEDNDPYYSPDGTTIAWLRKTNDQPAAYGGSWAIYKMNSNGSGQGAVIDDGNSNSKPNWADNQTIYFHRLVFTNGAPTGGYGIWKIGINGLGLTTIIPSPPYTYGFPDIASY